MAGLLLTDDEALGARTISMYGGFLGNMMTVGLELDGGGNCIGHDGWSTRVLEVMGIRSRASH